MAPRLSTWTWVIASAALHALLAVASLVPPLPKRAAGAAPATAWVEAVAPQPEPPPPPAPPPPAPAAPAKEKRAPAKTPQTNAAQATAEPEPEPESTPGVGQTAPELESDDGTLAIGAGGTGSGGTGEGSAGSGTGSGSGEATQALPERKPGATQLSLWMDIPALVSMALVRPGIALLMSVPGYADTLRGSGINPFSDLQRLRIRLSGVSADRLTVAGVHGAGERPLLAAAERVAAMRNRQPVWRGDADLRATSWVDGSGVDRGLAVHGDAFLISARATMPALLGSDDPAGRVPDLSRMHRGVAMLLTIEDAIRYLPALDPCALQALRVSVNGAGAGYRMLLSAEFRAASFASNARACVQGLAGTAQLSNLVAWLAQAQSAPDSYRTTLNASVTSDDVEHLLTELAWALRSAGRG